MSKRRDAAETAVNMSASAVISVVVTFVALPLLGVAVAPAAGLAGAGLYFGANVTKTYAVRRWFRAMEERDAG